MAASPLHRPLGRIRGWIGFLARFGRLAGPYWRSEAKWRVGLLSTLLILLTAGQVAIVVAFNRWYEQLFDALEERALTRLLLLVGALILIIAGTAGVTTAHLWVKRRIQIGWRNWLTDRLLGEWMSSGRHYQVTYIPGEHDNPDGRIAEDIRITTEYAIDLAHSLLYCLLLLVSFTHILWTLSGPPELRFGTFEFYLPGHMVWVAVAYSAIGSTVALLLGWPLIRAANMRQTAEANFRFGLVRARENSLAIALLSGEADERRGLRGLFRGAIAAWNRQTVALTRLLFFSSSWSVLSQVFPILVSAPRFISGAITLGVLMQTAQAFQQMAAALSWPIDNLAKAAEWRASAERVDALHDAIDRVTGQITRPDYPTIIVEPHGQPTLAFVDCTVNDPDGGVAIDSFRLTISAGERVLISGDPDAAMKLFKAVAGLWPWGRGRILLPSDGDIFFMPQRPYMPLGTLCEAISYPTSPESFETETIHDALRHTGLDALIPRLAEQDSWEQNLPTEVLQRIGFARLLLHRPRWIFLEEASSALDTDAKTAMMFLLQDALPRAAIVTFSQDNTFLPVHRRHLALLRTDNVTRLIAQPSAAPIPTP